MKRLASLALIVLLITALLAGCSGGSSSAPPAAPASASAAPASSAASESTGEKQTIVLTVMTQQHAYFQAVIATWQGLAEQNGFELTVMDPNSDNAALETIVEDIIALEPAGVAFAPLDNEIGAIQAGKMKDAGIPVVAYNMALAEPVVPNVLNGNYEGSVMLGEEAANVWKENHPDEQPVIGMINLFGIKEGDDRCNGFMDGFNKVYPDVEAAQIVNGFGARDKSLSAAEDMLQANPDINIIYGINDDSSLGALDALKEVGKGTIDKALVASTDGSEAAVKELLDPESALKCSVGVPPRGMAETTYEALTDAMAGNAADDAVYEVVFQLVFPDTAEQWLEDQYLK